MIGRRSSTRRRLAAAGALVAALAACAAGSAAGAAAPVVDVSPAWSPDGKLVAFVQKRTLTSGAGALYVMNADGTGSRRIVPETPGLDWPTWSPQGDRIAFHADNCCVYVVAARGGARRTLVDRRDGGGFYPDWSPGGRKIAYNTPILDTDVGDIMVTNPDGSGKALVAASDGGAAFATPTWSPDGQRLAFVVVDAPDSPGGTVPHLAYVDRYRGPVKLLTRVRAGEPDWAPDGRTIAFTSSDGGSAAIRTLDLVQHHSRLLHAGEHPRWSPDGREIVFTDGGQIYVMHADGSDVRQLTR